MVGMSKAKMENRALPKRFYKTAAAVDGRILLDGRELKTQARNPLVIPSSALAEAIAAEWNTVEEQINPDRMPLTRLMNLTIDRAEADRDAMIQTILDYTETDLLCYRAPMNPLPEGEGGDPRSGEGEGASATNPDTGAQARPHRLTPPSPSGRGLNERQAAAFDPVLIWAAGQGIRLDTTDSVMPIAQPQLSLQAARALLEQANAGELTALAMMVPLLGSALLALAIWQGEVHVEAAISMAHLDEDAQAEQWGVDEEAEAAWEHKKNDITASAFFLTHNALK